MHFSSTAWIILLSSLLPSASAVVLPGLGGYHPLQDDPHDPYTWTTDYIKRNLIKNMPTGSNGGNCYFYTNGLKNEAVNWAQLHNGLTVYDVYGKGKGGPFDEAEFPYKVFVAKKDERTWWKITSRAFAEVCTGNAYLIIKDGDYARKDSIWLTDEYDAIEKGASKIDKIYVIDPTQTPAREAVYDKAKDKDGNGVKQSIKDNAPIQKVTVTHPPRAVKRSEQRRRADTPGTPRTNKLIDTPGTPRMNKPVDTILPPVPSSAGKYPTIPETQKRKFPDLYDWEIKDAPVMD